MVMVFHGKISKTLGYILVSRLSANLLFLGSLEIPSAVIRLVRRGTVCGTCGCVHFTFYDRDPGSDLSCGRAYLLGRGSGGSCRCLVAGLWLAVTLFTSVCFLCGRRCRFFSDDVAKVASAGTVSSGAYMRTAAAVVPGPGIGIVRSLFGRHTYRIVVSDLLRNGPFGLGVRSIEASMDLFFENWAPRKAANTSGCYGYVEAFANSTRNMPPKPLFFTTNFM